MSQRSRVRISFLTALIVVITACERDSSSPTASPSTWPHDAASGSSEAKTIGDPLPFLSLYQRRLFFQGSAVFQREFTPATGLGPLFNNNSCAQCHEDPVIGGVGEEVETHATAYAGGVCSDLASVGGPVVQDSVTPALHAALGINGEPLPPGATASGRRTTPSILGFGLLDAVPEEVILSHADPDDRNHDGISGRPNRAANGHVGRFGRKAQVDRLSAFNAVAFIMEMGITNPDNQIEQTVGGNPLPAGVDPTPEPEITQTDVDAASAFVQLLAPPRERALTLETAFGRKVFVEIGCAGCHLPGLRTGPNRIFALSNRVVHAYTDLLLHDMGPALADICLGLAEPSEFRTEPLMGLRFKTAFLHDGRAPTIEEAIRQHAGEGARAQSRFVALGPLGRAALLKVLSRL
jgi:CxxC motif-containing protein (DUF1111 family)